MAFTINSRSEDTKGKSIILITTTTHGPKRGNPKKRLARLSQGTTRRTRRNPRYPRSPRHPSHYIIPVTTTRTTTTTIGKWINRAKWYIKAPPHRRRIRLNPNPRQLEPKFLRVQLPQTALAFQTMNFGMQGIEFSSEFGTIRKYTTIQGVTDSLQAPL